MKISCLALCLALIVLTSCTQSADDTEASQAADSTAKHGNHHDKDADLPLHTLAFGELVERFESEERAEWQKPDLVIDKLGDLEGLSVADLGAGTGYFAFRLAEKAKHVIAIDVDEKFVRYMNERRMKADVTNLETRLAEYHNPYLGPQEVDLILMVDVYHHIEDRVDYFKLVRSSLRPFGSLWVVDFKKGDLPVGPPDKVKLSPEEVTTELQQAGYDQFNIDTSSLQYQYIIEAKP